jgi:DNA-binding response OmpR family regulator
MSKKNILIADDEAIYATVYKLKLEAEGFNVSHAKNGIEVLELAKKSKPDIILLDLMMPEKDGFHVLKELKDDSSLKDVPVIIMTNLTQTSDIEEVLRLGAKTYLIKSDNTAEQMVDKVKENLK